MNEIALFLLVVSSRQMRKFLIIVLTASLYLSCSKTNSASGGGNTPVVPDTLNTWVKTKQVAASLQDVWFLNSQSGIVASGNSLYSSADSGNTWTAIPNTASLQAFNLQFTNNLNGFAQSSSQLGTSNDGGKTWIIDSLVTTSAINFQFINSSTGFYDDINSGLYKTTDGGAHWAQSVGGIDSLFQQSFPFYFLDSLHGFIVTFGNFSKTDDGGATWQMVDSNVTQDNFTGFYKMQFFDSLNGYFSSPQGLFLTTTGGISWQNVLPSSGFVIPYFLDINNGYCGVGNRLYQTTNGGQSWAVSFALGNDVVSGLHFLDMNTGWASTFNGYVVILKP
jgi:photosystem II stability/assembly factor-like uncharacterized protein